jgi:hypothetical protein
MNYKESDFNSSEKATEILCDMYSTDAANMNIISDYSIDGGRRMLESGFIEPGALSTAAGIALSGGYIFNAVTGGNADAVEY